MAQNQNIANIAQQANMSHSIRGHFGIEFVNVEDGQGLRLTTVIGDELIVARLDDLKVLEFVWHSAITS